MRRRCRLKKSYFLPSRCLYLGGSIYCPLFDLVVHMGIGNCLFARPLFVVIYRFATQTYTSSSSRFAPGRHRNLAKIHHLYITIVAFAVVSSVFAGSRSSFSRLAAGLLAKVCAWHSNCSAFAHSIARHIPTPFILLLVTAPGILSLASSGICTRMTIKAELHCHTYP